MKEARLYRLSRPFVKGFTKLVYRPRYVGLENIPKEGGVLLAGTHTNNLDCLLLMSSTKRSIHFLAKDELWQGAKKIIFANMGLIPVNRRRKDHAAIVQAEEYLNSHCVVGIFPEGTTEKGRGLLPFKMGTVKMAYDTQKEIVPFAIVGKYRVFHRGLTIVFGKPYFLESEDLVHENEVLREKVKSLIELGEKYGENK